MYTNKNILLICWDFPPNDGIGGRRWAKFAKALVRKGYTVHVIKSAPPEGNKTSPWFKDVDSGNIKTYEIRPYWASVWLHTYSSKLSPLKIKIAQAWLSAFFKGTIYDKAIGTEKKFLELAKDVITKNNISKVIVTGAPFNLIYYTALLKQELPALQVLADYRDPWINSVNYGMDKLKDSKMQDEKNKQDLVFNTIDVITAPNAFLVEQIKHTYNVKVAYKTKLEVLSHLYDPDDTVGIATVNKKDPKKLRIAYAGAFYTDSGPYLGILADAIRHFRDARSDLQVELDVYSGHRSAVFKEKGVEKNVTFREYAGDKIFGMIREYDLLVILLASHNKDFKTTKFFEFLPYKVPYLYVGPEGFVSESIRTEKLGYVLKNKEDLTGIYEKLKAEQNLDGFNTTELYSLPRVTEKLLKLLEETS